MQSYPYRARFCKHLRRVWKDLQKFLLIQDSFGKLVWKSKEKLENLTMDLGPLLEKLWPFSWQHLCDLPGWI